MSDQELFNLLALLRIEGVGDVVAKKLLLHCGSAEEIFKSKSSTLKGIDGIGTFLTNNLKNKTVTNPQGLFILTTRKRKVNRA